MTSKGRSRDKVGADAPIARNFLDTLDVGVAHLSVDGTILYANPHFCELLGCASHHEITGVNLKKLVSAGSWQTLAEALAMAESELQVGELQVGELQGGLSRRRVIRLTLGPIVNGKEVTIRASATDITALVEANASVRERESKLQVLTARILLVQDEERRRIARDLHDATGQELVSIGMLINAALRSAGAIGGDARQSLGDADELLHKVQEEIRTLSYLLHPPLLDELGLGSALGWYVDGFKKRSGIDVTFDMPARPPRLSIEIETALFRVAQEGLANVLRHSGSTKACLKLLTARGELFLLVEDEGKGIEERRLIAANAERAEFGVGIPGIRERLKQFGGSLELRSSKTGTQLIARMPLSKELHHAPPTLQVVKQDAEVRATPSEPHRARILIADDHDVTRRGIRSLLADQPDFEVCGEAADGFEAVQKAVALNPDVVVMDLSMPKVGGLSAAQHIRQSGVRTRILVFTTHSYPGLERSIEAAGCQGYVHKANAAQDLVRGVRALLSGDKFYPSEPAGQPVGEQQKSPEAKAFRTTNRAG
jgi:two-component system, NarL family, sensor kinase